MDAQKRSAMSHTFDCASRFAADKQPNVRDILFFYLVKCILYNTRRPVRLNGINQNSKGFSMGKWSIQQCPSISSFGVFHSILDKIAS